jgi:hypothetical protein
MMEIIEGTTAWYPHVVDMRMARQVRRKALLGQRIVAVVIDDDFNVRVGLRQRGSCFSSRQYRPC